MTDTHEHAAACSGASARVAGSRVDVHCHYIPDFYHEALMANGHAKTDGVPFIPPWSEEEALEVMDQLGVKKQYLSVSSPGVHFGSDAAARDLARRVNEEGARLSHAHPERFGFFASTPLPDVGGALTEISYAFDHLGAAGVVFMTNFHGIYHGDELLEPVYAELDRRNAVIFLHPTSPATSSGRGGRWPMPYPRSLGEFLFDTTRSVTHLVVSGVLDRYRNLRVIVPYAGAALPVMASGMDLVGRRVGSGKPHMVHDALRRLHFDLAGLPLPDMLAPLLRVTDPTQIHYGTDYPFTPVPEIERIAAQLDNAAVLTGLELAMYGNSEALFRSDRSDVRNSQGR
ncbi:amidohydrolase family protein [Nocardia sp. CA-119907]|uniref:amidohydrolase family protein n=1 Tax=Nocardia sp. CA-119907 TaxID=3239973 RepID=UPI003D99E308